ncbi:interleukin 21 receptor, tandem duplicate 1 isoform X2 [Antennarius striatus]|uniref:interleukin 21 receptor, tandem duplicate 1 isoform X2 n=1 Tax=Antennarius striatus TaxID=241820 RepID=UPI0035AD9096
MALRPASLLLLLGLALFLPGITSLCDVVCSTDYKESLNCSCSGSAPKHPVFLQVNCSDGEIDAVGSCEIEPPGSWCVMSPEMFFDVASIGTNCIASSGRTGDEGTKLSGDSSSMWALSDVVKVLPPFDVKVRNIEGLYNITWNHGEQLHCLTYTVLIRDSSEDPVYSLTVEQKQILLDKKKLQPNVNYTVAVKARFCPGEVYEGPWSEWSSAAGWRSEGGSWCLLYVSTSIVSVTGFLVLLRCLRKPCVQKKMELIAYIPRPDSFFDSFFNDHKGNFKEWVKSGFDEREYLQMNSEKQHDVLLWSVVKHDYGDDELNPCSHFLQRPQPHSNSLLFFQGGGSGGGSTGTGHSSGHISIQTVTLSGEEEFEENVDLQSSGNTFRSYQEGQSFGSSGGDGGEQAGMDRQSEAPPCHDNQISTDSSEDSLSFQLSDHPIEPEMASLVSFASNEQSEDGYPHVDLDTIDSGFGECSSPGVSNMTDDGFSNSNYVKQWMVCGDQELAGDSELQQS